MKGTNTVERKTLQIITGLAKGFLDRVKVYLPRRRLMIQTTTDQAQVQRQLLQSERKVDGIKI